MTSHKSDSEGPQKNLVLRGQRISEDVNGLICLDDIWEAAKGSATRAPAKWRRLTSTKRLEEALQKKITISALKENKPFNPVAYAKRGRGGFTATFFVQCLVAIGCTTLHLGDA